MNVFWRQYSRIPANIRKTIRVLLPDRLLRWYSHARIEVYLLSYPKCGRTWLRLMMGKAIALHYALPEEEDILFLRTNRRVHPDVPVIAVIHDDSPMLKTPSELQVSKERYRNKKVIFLVRDPRDVVVSSFFEVKKRGKIFGDNPHENRQVTFEGELEDFIHHPVGSFDTILKYYQIWANNQHIPDGFLLIRYEDLKSNPSSQLRRVLDFAGLDAISDEEIAEAVSYASFDNMRKMELERQFNSGILNPGDPSDPDSFKTRAGKISGYHDYLTKEQITELDSLVAQNLPTMYGYNSA